MDIESILKRNFPEVKFHQIFEHDTGVQHDTKCYFIDDDKVLLFSSKEGVYSPLSAAKKLKTLENYNIAGIPKVIATSKDAVVMTRIPGREMAPYLYQGLCEDRKDKVALGLARILQGFSKVEAHDELKGCVPEYFQIKNSCEQFEEKLLSKLKPHAQQFYRSQVLDFVKDKSRFDTKPCFVHAEPAPTHIYMDEEQNIGMIDFGHSGIGDQAWDLGMILMKYGADLLNRIYHFAPELEKHRPRAKFYAYFNILNFLHIGSQSESDHWIYLPATAAYDFG